MGVSHAKYPGERFLSALIRVSNTIGLTRTGLTCRT